MAVKPVLLTTIVAALEPQTGIQKVGDVHQERDQKSNLMRAWPAEHAVSDVANLEGVALGRAGRNLFNAGFG